jgi:hypothetical protein
VDANGSRAVYANRPRAVYVNRPRAVYVNRPRAVYVNRPRAVDVNEPEAVRGTDGAIADSNPLITPCVAYSNADVDFAFAEITLNDAQMYANICSFNIAPVSPIATSF